jgi:hypothetical protein
MKGYDACYELKGIGDGLKCIDFEGKKQRACRDGKFRGAISLAAFHFYRLCQKLSLLVTRIELSVLCRDPKCHHQQREQHNSEISSNFWEPIQST